MHVTRIFTGSDGESHFEDIDIPLRHLGHIGATSELIEATGLVLRETGPDYDLDFHNAPRRQFFITLPRSLDEAARLDGCGELRLFWSIILPSAKPALATVAAFAFIWTWTDFYWPLLASSSTTMRTLEVGLSIFKDSYGGMQWSLQMAAAVIVLIPVLIVFLAMQRFFVKGVVLSGMKE